MRFKTVQLMNVMGIFALALSATSFGDPEPTMHMRCMSTVFEPYVFEQAGEVVGIDVDVIKDVGRRLGIDIIFGLKPWIRLEKEIAAGTEECAFAYFRTEGRQEYMHFTNVPLHITSYTLFVLEENQRLFTKMADIEGFSVAVNLGFKTPPQFQTALEEGVVSDVRVNEEQQSFKMLKAKRVDAVLTNYFVGAYQVKQNNYRNIATLFPPLKSTPAYLTFAKKDELLPWVEKFDSALFEILIDGTYQEIFNKYTKVTKDQ